MVEKIRRHIYTRASTIQWRDVIEVALKMRFLEIVGVLIQCTLCQKEVIRAK